MHYVRCPFCLSTLQVSEEQLSQKSGMIRCGRCNEIFDANKNELTPAAKKILLNKAEETTNPPDYSTDNLIPATDENEPPVIAAWENVKKKPVYKLPYGFLSFLLVITLMIQVTYIESAILTQNIHLQPVIKKLNNAYNLQIPSYKKLEEIHIVQRQLSPHPNQSHLLLFQLTLKNNALVEQPYPTIKLLLTAHSGELIAEGIFNRHDYLADKETNDFFPAQALKDIKILFEKPNTNAAGFEISFMP